jgi:hypothetical protein
VQFGTNVGSHPCGKGHQHEEVLRASGEVHGTDHRGGSRREGGCHLAKSPSKDTSNAPSTVRRLQPPRQHDRGELGAEDQFLIVAGNSARCRFTASTSIAGSATTRTPAADFGGPATRRPSRSSANFREILTVPASRSRSQRRTATSSPHRRPVIAANNTSTRNRGATSSDKAHGVSLSTRHCGSARAGQIHPLRVKAPNTRQAHDRCSSLVLLTRSRKFWAPGARGLLTSSRPELYVFVRVRAACVLVLLTSSAGSRRPWS